ncbi:MAG: cytochrome c biogenesis protein CcdA [candidate division KSB1 bacterium]|nr:cytochrome c biogenesis protein CcdA [candidate division KSB1 bacterium]
MKQIFVLLFVLLVITQLFGQFGDMDMVDVNVLSSLGQVPQGKQFQLAVVLNIKEGLHINSHDPGDDFYIPTRIHFESTAGISIGQPVFPEPKFVQFSFTDGKISVYEGETAIIVPVTVSPELSPKEHSVSGTVSYQGCNDNMCFPPDSVQFTKNFKVVAADTDVTPVNSEIFQNADIYTTKDAKESLNLTPGEQRALEYLEKGLFSAILAFFVVGLALNLTPCVYPVIPMTVSYFGGQSDKTRAKAFTNALLYVVGIALSFAILGLLSGLAGKQWGFLFQSPWFVVAIATIILLMAASLFGAFEITVPSWLLTKVGQSREGIIGSFLMGITVGIVIAPCAAGIIIGLVGLIAKLGLVVKGTLLFFVMGLGLGLPYLFLATFSSLLGKLPQSGVWMLWIRKLFGFLLIGVAFYFIIPQLELVPNKLGFLLGLLALTAGLLLGFLEQGQYKKSFKIFRAVVGLVLIALSIVWIQGSLQAKTTQVDWIKYSGQSYDQIIDGDKPVFIDFYADWCAPCKQMDRTTFTDPQVGEVSEQFEMIKVDCTKPDAATQDLMQRFGVSGMPTLVFLDKDGKEFENLREIGYIGPEKFVEHLNTVLE